MGEHVTSVACGWRHSACLTAGGRLYTWGHGGYGQLGHGGAIHFFLPLQVQTTATVAAYGSGGKRESDARRDGHGLMVPAGVRTWEQISCGWRHTAALASGGVAHTWGDGEHLQLGHGQRECETRPREVVTLGGDALRQLECGSHHCAAVSSAGRLLTWGSGSFGQLGHGERRAESLPRLVVSLAAVEIVRVACGGHTAALSAHGVRAASMRRIQHTPHPVHAVPRTGAHPAGAAGWHARRPCSRRCRRRPALRSTNVCRLPPSLQELYTFGNGKHGQLGHGVEQSDGTPRQVHGLRHTRVLGIACGDFHSLALGADGLVYTWGAGGFGELGHAELVHASTPRPVEALRRHTLVFAACGASHNVLLLSAAPARGHGSDGEGATSEALSGEEEPATRPRGR